MTQRPLLLRPDDPIEIEKAMVTAISAVFREKNITHTEYERFREMIRALQDFNAVEGWLDVWLDRMPDETTADEWEGTPTNPEGPYYIPAAPLLQPTGPGASYVLPMRPDEPGTPLIVRGLVRSIDGKPLAGAELDTWQCADTDLLDARRGTTSRHRRRSPPSWVSICLAYGLAKRANQLRVAAASVAWGRRGARINSISPGVISTPMGQQERASESGRYMRAMIDASVAGRTGTAEDIAAAVAFLLGPESNFITGTDLLVDGGVVAPSAPAS